MKLRIRYRATYLYEEEVSLSPHTVRLFPRDISHAGAVHTEFSTNDSSGIHWRRDLFDNLTAHCFYPEESDRLTFALDAELSVAERNPFAFLIEKRAMHFPVAYTPHERDVLGLFFRAESCLLPPELEPPGGSPTVDALVAMNQWIHSNIAYERREEGEPLPAEETLARGRGACRDTAVLLASALRASGIAARLAGGYLWESVTDPGARRAESALHAWTEAYLPGAGWTSFDPSNGVLADHHYVTTAVGFVPDDIAPVSGLYFGDRTIPGSLESSVRVERI